MRGGNVPRLDRREHHAVLLGVRAEPVEAVLGAVVADRRAEGLLPRAGHGALVEHVRHAALAQGRGELHALLLGEAQLTQVDRPDGAPQQKVEEAGEEVVRLQRDHALQEGHLDRRALLEDLLQQVAHLHWLLLVNQFIDVQHRGPRLEEGGHLARDAAGNAVVADRPAPSGVEIRERQLLAVLILPHRGQVAERSIRRLAGHSEKVSRRGHPRVLV